MKIINKIVEFNQFCSKIKSQQQTIALVPTMGTLHQGHLELIKLAQTHADQVVVSIFVNPQQFNSAEDYEKYPRELEQDLEKLRTAQVSAVFSPELNEIYPDNFQTKIDVSQLSALMEGPNRPGHFAGVCTIVLKLFNISQADFAVFGKKDFQQLRIMEQLVQDLNLNIKIIPAEIVREASGLAMSSRNVRLSEEGKTLAANIQRILQAAKALTKTEKNSAKIINTCQEMFSEHSGIEVEYLTINDAVSLQEIDTIDEQSRIFFAGYVEGIRLIDNLALN